jgi:hypothetical protein
LISLRYYCEQAALVHGVSVAVAASRSRNLNKFGVFGPLELKMG